MAHFAVLDESNTVIAVIVGRDQDDEIELSERTGQTYKRTSYNTYANVHRDGGEPFRYNFAGVGYTFDETIGTDGAFIPPQPYPSWTLDENCEWQPPSPRPGENWEWVEAVVAWVES